MDTALFSVNSLQTLALTSFTTPIPSQATNLRSIRQDFFGSCNNLWPPGYHSLRFRGKSKRIGVFQVQSPRFVVRASVDSGLLLVFVAVGTFSAISVAYFSRYYGKKKHSSQVTGSPALSDTEKEITGHVQEDKSLDFVDNLKGTSPQMIVELEETEDNRILVEEAKADLKFRETTLTHEDSLVTKSIDSLTDLAFCSSLDINLIASEVTNQHLPSHVPLESVVMKSLAYGSDVCDSQVQKGKQETGYNDFPRVSINLDSVSYSPCTIDTESARVDEHIHVHEKHVEANEITTLFGIVRESSREELHTFFGTNQSKMRSPNINGLKAVHAPSTSPKRTTFSSLKRNREAKGETFLAHSSHQVVDDLEGKTHAASDRGNLAHKWEELRGDRGSGGTERNIPFVQQANGSILHWSNPLGVLTNDRERPSYHFGAYKRLLKMGRATDCIDLLEGMDMRGLLDTDKIHHASFFKLCKTEKAVKEAFRFTNLVSNPTLSTFNMLMAVCASSQDTEGAVRVLQLVQEAGLLADCKLYTTLISTCAKSGKVDAMFEVFHKMVNCGVEPNIHTYGALIDGCARAGQVAKAFGAYGIMRSKNVKPDRVVFNALITACGQSGAVDRAFDVLAEMRAELQPIDPDHVTVGALIKACSIACQIDRAREVYNMIHKYDIKGTPEVYTIAVNCCSGTGDWEFACSVYSDMKKKCVTPDEVFFSALIDAAGHAGQLDGAFEILDEAKSQGLRLGIISYSSLMGACSKAKNWQKALEVYETIKSIKLKPTVSTINALITALCNGDQLPKAMEILSEMKRFGVLPNSITYSMLLVACERKDDLEAGILLLSQTKNSGVVPKLLMCRCIIRMCLRRFEKACVLGEPVLSFNSGRPQIENEWTSLALTVYRETIVSGNIPSMEIVSLILGCLRLPCDASLRKRMVENLGLSAVPSKHSNLYSLVDGFAEYDPRAFSVLEEVASLGIVPLVSFKQSPIVVDTKKLQHTYTAEVYLLTVFKGLKHRLAAGAKLPNINILLPVVEGQIVIPEEEKMINLAGKMSQAIAALLRRLEVPYQGNESLGKIKINGLSLRRWLQPKLNSPFSGKPGEFKSSQSRLGNEIFNQQRDIRTGNLSLD